MPSLKNILRELRKELIDKEKARETAQKDMRKAISQSKQAILLIHQKRLDEAGKLIEDAKGIISKLRHDAMKYPETLYSGLYNAALQEFSEANILLNLIQGQVFVTPEDMEVPSVDYVLGLADVIGEYRRLALDALREGQVQKGEACLKMMDEIYIELMAMDEAYMLVPGLRRKCDVARKIIETTRGDITQEVRRESLEKHLRLFEKLQRKTKKKRTT